ncbi:MAG: PIG-L family deacetylase [Actinomycetota bacterium]
MATAVFFHAHPDDEAIATAGTMTKAVRDGHRVVLVCATRGEQGTPLPGVLKEGEELWRRRELELEDACRILGAPRLEFLGYADSGMMGEQANHSLESFWSADIEEAARRLANILEEEEAQVLTIYDEHGGYGHPDHIQVHRVGLRAAELAGTPNIFMSTMNRSQTKELIEGAGEFGFEVSEDIRESVDTLGVPADQITTAVDVTDFLDEKRRAMAAHASQIADNSPFLGMPPDVFAVAWGTEWYVKVGVEPSGELQTSLFDY